MFKYLASTQLTQGQKKNDFCFVEEGVPVKFGFVCDGEKPDDGCGCARSMTALDGKGSTTTVMVMETEDPDFISKIKRCIAHHYVNGWLLDKKEATRGADADMKDMTGLTESCEVGDILEIAIHPTSLTARRRYT